MGGLQKKRALPMVMKNIIAIGSASEKQQVA